ncbi:spore maturation protein CgeB [Neobacillus niacini]|uniref:CgeB family protein n=1 Tax=Neobacillus driksii TaxID=3035913 RepID=UPI0027899C36|nr:glycosyltransferase [Neobacillus niacini]MDQ0974577.1 spore maturation protein CgeB [Neobacillus niacini]
MENLVTNKLKKLGQDKLQYKKQLKALNPNFELSNIDEILKVELSKLGFGSNDKIKTKNKDNGIDIQSALTNTEHQYIYIGNLDELKVFKEFFDRKSNKRLDLSFTGYCDKTLEIEFHIIFILKDGKRSNIKIVPGKNVGFTVPTKETVDSIKIAIRVKGSGYAYLHNPYLYSQDLTISANNRSSQNRVPKKIKDMKVIFIGDEFTTRSFEPEFNLVKVTPENWEEEVTAAEPDMFFCESAWLGNNGAWQNKVGTGGPRDNTTLLKLVEWCKANNIPTAFWNKEDPFHYNAFVETAKHFDYVYTTDSNSVEKYTADGCKNVFSFPFAAQPAYHNPIEKYKRINKVVFAGAYYGDKFPERKQAMDSMIEISGKYGMEIYDRNYNIPESPNQFPEGFKKHIVGTLKGDEIEKAYKGYKISLNVNSIVDSPTMFSRRVFEIIASNTPVVSSASLGIENLFGDIIIASNNFNELQERIQKYFEDEYYFKTNRLLGLRKVLEEHTYTHRVKMMLDQMGIEYIDEDQSVTVVGVVRSKEDYEELMKQYNRQAWKSKKLVILLDIFEGYLDIFNANNNKEVKTYLIDYLHNYNSLNDVIDTEYFAVFEKRNYYGDYYLTDMMLATLYVQDAIIVKGSGEEYTFTTTGQIAKSLIRKKSTGIINPVGLLNIIENKGTNVLDDWFKYGARFFNIDDFNFINNYRGKKNIAKKIKQLTV